jgi:hypothetical protein
MKEFPVDAGMIGVVPVAAMQRADGCPDGGIVIKVQGGRYLNLHYDNGRITITADLNGAIPVLEDTEFWVGDLCYVLENNIPIEDREWHKSAAPAAGYWAACVSSFETPRYGCSFAKPFRLDGGMAGLVSRTQWGDGLYPGSTRTEGDYTASVTIETGDDFDDEEEE